VPAFPTLRRRRDFEAVGRSGTPRSCRLLLVRVRRNDVGVTRIGMSTPRGAGGAVRRNRLRRRMREAVRAEYGALRPGWDVLVVARLAAADASLAELRSAFRGLARRSGIDA
jgi:ribonuclease P protein component